MAAKSPKFVIGLFLILGALIGAAILVWIGASRYFERGDLYVIYFDESVQGLQRDSVVKFRGLSVGRVVKIGVAPDDKLMEVRVKISLDRNLSQCSVAQLTQIGITGLAFIDLSHIGPRDWERTPRLTFRAPYPVIASRPSKLRQIEMSIEQVMTKLSEFDLAGIGTRVEATVSAAERAVSSPRMERIMANLDSVMASLDKTTSRMDSIMAKGRIETILADAGESLKDSRALVKRIREDFDALRLADTAGKIDRSAALIETNSRRILRDMNRSGENLSRASASLDMLLERLERNPSELLFSQPPPPGRSE